MAVEDNGSTASLSNQYNGWMYTRGDKIYGGYTIDPLLVTYPKEEADELRAKLVR